MKLKKIAAVALAGMMALSVAACGENASTETSGVEESTQSSGGAASKEEQNDAIENSGAKTVNADPANQTVTDETLKIGLASEPSTLWGAGCGKTENEMQIISGALMDTLVVTDQNTGDILPNLATEWTWVDDTHCKFTLRDDVTMTDGTPLTADDVKYSVGVWTTESANNDTGKFFDDATTTVEDEHTIIIGFNTNAPDLLSMLAYTNFGIVSEDEVNAAGGLEAACNNPVMGSGKYIFKEWKQGQSITLERNDNYWNDDYKGYYKTIVFTFTQDAAAREMAVESGDLDVAYDMPVNTTRTFVDSENVSTVVYSFGQVAHLWYNMQDDSKATADQKVREAIDKAIDFDALAQVGTAGFGAPSLGYFGTDSKCYNETYTTEERQVDIEGAKALLEEAGYGDGLELTALGLQDTAPVYTVIQENLRAIGITLTIDTPDVPQFVQGAFGGDYDLIVVGEYTAARVPTLFCFLQYDNIYGEGMVIGGPKWTTEDIDASISELIEESDETKAKEEAAAIENVLKEQTIVSNLYPEMKSAIMNKELKGYTTRERGFLDPTNFYKD